MSRSPSPPTPRLLFRLLLPVLFLAFLFLPLMDSLFGFAPKFELNEKRELSPMPELSDGENSFEKFPERFDTYYDDNFGFRVFLTYWHNYIKMFWFGSSPTHRVVLGKDGWLFYGENFALESYQRRKSLSSKECTAWKRSLRLIEDWLYERETPFVIMVPPNKSTIYGEYMPDSIIPREVPPLLDQFIECVGEAGIEVLDFRDELRASRDDLPLYPRTDTHWGPAGAHLAYRKLMESLTSQFPGLNIGVPSSIRLGDKEDYTGDLAVMAGLAGLSEKRPQVMMTGEFDTPKVTEGESRFGENFTLETGREDLPSAVIFRDSFGVQFIPFLSPHFRRLRTVWDYGFDIWEIEKERPDIVFLEIVERYLSIGPDLLGRYSELTGIMEGIHAASSLDKSVGTDEVDENSSFGTVRSARAGVTPQGWLTFGPYRWMAPGSYRATFRMRIRGPEAVPLARIEVTADKGSRLMAQRTVLLEDFGGTAKWTDFDLAFTLSEEASDIEYRVKYLGNGDLDVDTIRLRDEVLP